MFEKRITREAQESMPTKLLHWRSALVRELQRVSKKLSEEATHAFPKWSDDSRPCLLGSFACGSLNDDTPFERCVTLYMQIPPHRSLLHNTRPLLHCEPVLT